MSGNPDNLTEVSSAERILLVEADIWRKKLQIIIAVVFIGGAYGLVFTYVFFKGFADPLVQEIVSEMKVLIIMGVGAALAIFGLGRTVGKKT